MSWRSGRFKPSEYTSAGRLKGALRLNHFPKSGAITRKDTLMRHIRKMRKIHGAVYDFLPDGV